MSRSMRDVGDHVMLSSMLLKHLKKLSESPIKVYIYLCSCKQPVTASIEMIGGAVGLKRRATIDALNTLENLKLISRSAGKGNAPNEYHPCPRQLLAKLDLDRPRRVGASPGVRE